MYDELHARPAVEITPPSLLTHLAYTTDYGRALGDRQMLIWKRQRITNLVRHCYQYFGCKLPFDIMHLAETSADEKQFLYQTEILAHFRNQVTLVKENRKCIIQTHTEFLGITFVLQRESLTDYDWLRYRTQSQSGDPRTFPDIATHIRIEKPNSEDLT